VLADPEGRRRLLTGAGRPAWGWRRPRHRGHDNRGHHRGDDRHLVIVLIILVVLIVIVDHNDDPDLDIDLLGVVQPDGITLRRLGGRGVGFVLVGVSGGVGWFFRHSISCEADG
jgi:hypothetical protein